ncbi:hypothetical protein PUMCH_004682 [Australozyma saopauloensis]|uniref:Peptidase S8/S53 domain-containing protein n=1 Tax=Australozyma saopauloensis TaxID=291208 RepID=A0AAX4HFW5_9ASCO|nr:hypothetical protein PUMCH_004682 [[Candida] saopauloensis]
MRVVIVTIWATICGAAVIPELHNAIASISTPILNTVGSLKLASSEEIDDKPLKYIVVLKNGYIDADYDSHQDWLEKRHSSLQKRSGALETIKNKFKLARDTQVQFFNLDSVKGYTAILSNSLVKALESNPLVEFVEKDEQIHLSKVATQNYAPWGLERISHRKIQRQLYMGRFFYDADGGKGVTVFVLDSGIDSHHPEFEGRVTASRQFGLSASLNDNNGHGTHVAGTIGGRTYGVAKCVNIESLKVLGSSGTGMKSSILMAIEYVIKSHKRRLRSGDTSYKGSIINLSLGSLPSNAMDRAVKAASEAGVVVVISAGNEGEDACKISPSRSEFGITVGATDYDDTFASFSNYGRCVDVLAPGVAIQSASTRNKPPVLTGTSMAAPHVAGVVATIMSMQPPINSEYSSGELLSAQDIKRKLLKYTTKNVIRNLPQNTPNKMVYNGGSMGFKSLD